ncbi:MAG: hypothetical protein OXF02_03410 [Simkaniaceae bacterium]|nr:hypothetical protein [Simkaniaceae bacterium]
MATFGGTIIPETAPKVSEVDTPVLLLEREADVACKVEGVSRDAFDGVRAKREEPDALDGKFGMSVLISGADLLAGGPLMCASTVLGAIYGGVTGCGSGLDFAGAPFLRAGLGNFLCVTCAREGCRELSKLPAWVCGCEERHKAERPNDMIRLEREKEVVTQPPPKDSGSISAEYEGLKRE